jgi:GNAT superfamily N-acetyltransferase
MASMGWRTTGDMAQFLAAAGDYLRRERARNTVLLTVAEQLRVNPAQYAPSHPARPADLAAAPLFGWQTGPGGEVAGAFLHTPPHPLLITAVSAHVAADLAVALAGRPLAAVNSYAEAAEAFAARWCDATGQRAAVSRRMRLYRLDKLAWPDPAPGGTHRDAADDDIPLLNDWFSAFAREVDEADDEEEQSAEVRDKLSYGGVLVWEAGGVPVSIACVTRQVAGMIRVGPVYTPRDARGHGYASAVTAAVSERALAAGAEEVLLYTDLANPVSNSIYQRIGYCPVEDRAVLVFSEVLRACRRACHRPPWMHTGRHYVTSRTTGSMT